MTNLDQLRSPCWKVHRHNDLRYYIDIERSILTAERLANSTPKCKYCKAYPFDVSSGKSTNKKKECELCGSINDFEVQFQALGSSVDRGWFEDYSFILPVEKKQELKVRCLMAIDPWLEENQLQFFFDGFAGAVNESNLTFLILICVGQMLGVIDLSSAQPQIIYLTADVDPKSEVSNYLTSLSSAKVEQLRTVVQSIRTSVVPPPPNGIKTIQKLISQYHEHHPFELYFLLWVARVPPFFQLHKASSIYTIGLFVGREQKDNENILFDLRLAFNQCYVLAGQDVGTQLYYKIYDVVGQTRYFHKTMPIIRTNVHYSGSFQTYLKGIVSHRSQLLEVSTTQDEPHKVQVQLQYFDVADQKWRLLVANYQDKGPYRCEPIEKGVIVTMALQFVLERYIKVYEEKRSKNSLGNILSFSFMAEALEGFAGQPAQMTNYVQALVHKMKTYFKQFQKNSVKFYRPFQLMGKKEIVGLFWPFLLGEQLHFVDGFYTCQDEPQQMQTLNQVLGKYYVPRQSRKKLDYYYRESLENGEVTHLISTPEQNG